MTDDVAGLRARMAGNWVQKAGKRQQPPSPRQTRRDTKARRPATPPLLRAALTERGGAGGVDLEVAGDRVAGGRLLCLGEVMGATPPRRAASRLQARSSGAELAECTQAGRFSELAKVLGQSMRRVEQAQHQAESRQDSTGRRGATLWQRPLRRQRSAANMPVPACATSNSSGHSWVRPASAGWGSDTCSGSSSDGRVAGYAGTDSAEVSSRATGAGDDSPDDGCTLLQFAQLAASMEGAGAVQAR